MSRTIGEGKKVVEAVQRNGRIFRINTWFRFQRRLLRNGNHRRPHQETRRQRPSRLAPQGHHRRHHRLRVEVLLDAGRPTSNREPVAPECTSTTTMWLGPAPYKPYHPHRTHGTFRGYWDYDGGGLGDMGQHYHRSRSVLPRQRRHQPRRGRSRRTPTAPRRLSVPGAALSLRYADGCEIVLDGEGKDEGVPYIEGPKGKLFKRLRVRHPRTCKKQARSGLPRPRTPVHAISAKPCEPGRNSLSTKVNGAPVLHHRQSGEDRRAVGKKPQV